ncbi:MAG: hypothetical protein L0216_12190 [Planctomycetales bacterium]|nr:hypothetical protein [Planctomycetales bacterium]
MALESPRVRADCIEANEFPDLSQQHEVMAVPRTVAIAAGDGKDKDGPRVLEGAVPEKVFLDFVLEAGARPE